MGIKICHYSNNYCLEFLDDVKAQLAKALPNITFPICMFKNVHIKGKKNWLNIYSSALSSVLTTSPDGSLKPAGRLGCYVLAPPK